MGVAVIQLVNSYWNQVLSSVPSVVNEFVCVFVCVCVCVHAHARTRACVCLCVSKYRLHSLSR